jgi:hypothetical protein
MEETMKIQESVVTDPTMEWELLGESPMRTIANRLRVNQLTTGQG